MTQLRSPLQAQVVQWLVAPGDAMRTGDVVVILEAMKMEHEVRSPGNGRVRERLFAQGETVQEGEVLLSFEPMEQPGESAPTPALPQRGRESSPAPSP
ncbi:MAG: Propionyl-CoA carboxylase, partial [Ramlibacter sp.]|nr:Propionyl-CoA carboxylase [Ramlibacter sp.]